MADMMLLVGNPNAGKSTLFNRLARAHAHVGNWHGVTVDALEKQISLGGRAVTLVDLPGVYTAAGKSLEEKYALQYIKDRPAASIVFVSECGRIERFAPLMAELSKGGRRCALVLTKKKRFEREGGKVAAAALDFEQAIEIREQIAQLKKRLRH